MTDAHDHLLADFGRLVDIPNLAFDNANQCTLQFDDTVITLEFQPERQDILITSIIGPEPQPAPPGMYRSLLAANGAAASLGGGTLGLDEDTGEIYWFDRINLRGLSQQEFQETIRLSLKRIEFWREELKGGMRPADASVDAEASAPDEASLSRWTRI